MLTLPEICQSGYELCTPVQKENMDILLYRMNVIRPIADRAMIVTSGLRSLEKHIAIYTKKGIPKEKIPMGSAHLRGGAVDLADKDCFWKNFCKTNEKLLKQVGLWVEHPDETPTWCHFQIFPYGSWKEGKTIFFKP